MIEADVAGSIQSEKTTPNQDEIIAYMSYFAKIAKIIEITHPVIKVERPDGFKQYLEAVEEYKKNNPEPNEEQLKKIEDETRWDRRVDLTLGNSTSVLNTLLRTACTLPIFDQMMERATKEAKAIAEQMRNQKMFSGQQDKRDLI